MSPCSTTKQALTGARSIRNLLRDERDNLLAGGIEADDLLARADILVGALEAAAELAKEPV